MLTKEEYKQLFKLIKEETSNHQGHYVIITTETLREIEDENRHDVILKGGKSEQGGGKKIKMANTFTPNFLTRNKLMKLLSVNRNGI